jgi:hypothetical protein
MGGRYLSTALSYLIASQFFFGEDHAATGARVGALQGTHDIPRAPLLSKIELSSCPSGQPDATTDNSACVQSMVDNICQAAGHRGGGLVRLWSGHWKLHDITVQCDGVHIKGAGAGNDSMATNAQSTSVDCSGMRNHCIQFVPKNYPAQFHLRGASVEGIRFFNHGGSGRVLDFVQVESGYVRDISMWEPPNGIRVFGSYGFEIRNVQQWGSIGIAYEIAGDTSGKASNGRPCTLGDCSTRTDYVVMSHLYGTASSSNTFLYIHDQAFTVYGNDIQQENGGAGLKVRCSLGKPDISYCPQQIIFKGFNVEYTISPVDLKDFTWFRCVSCYMAGDPKSTKHVITAQLQNYLQSGGGGGGVTLIDNQIYGANGSCVWFDVSDTTVIGSQINGCNGSDVGGFGIQYHSGEQHHVSDATFCKSLGAAPRSMGGILVDVAASKIAVTAPMYYGCRSGLVNNSALPETVTTVNAQGP